MTSSLVALFSFTAEPTTLAVILAVVALVCGGLASYAALYSAQSPAWVRADVAVVAVALYAFAFGRLRIIDPDAATQILAYSVGFLAASMLEPLTAQTRAPEKPDEGD